jgi:hypothetical protein
VAQARLRSRGCDRQFGGLGEWKMSSKSLQELLENLRSARTAPLFVMRLVVPKMISVGAAPGAFRRLGPVSGGKFEGERLSGEVLSGGNDWQDVRADGSTTLDVRLVLKTNDDALIAMRYRGMRHGPPDVLARIDRGEAVDSQSYYFRISSMFETASETYAWLNRILAIGVGHRLPDGPVYSIFEVL